jgi:hypothetical protein
MRKTLFPTALAVLLPVALLSGCGSSTDAQPSSSTASASSSATSGPFIDVTVHGNKITPNGDRIDAKVGQPVTLRVTSDRAGELHVHSTPEQELAYKAGTTTLKVTVDKPGIVDVEDHVADVVVVQLQVS